VCLSGLELAQSPREGLNLLGGLGGWEVLGSFGWFFFCLGGGGWVWGRFGGGFVFVFVFFGGDNVGSPSCATSTLATCGFWVPENSLAGFCWAHI
jgi:hypothetical protein